MQVRAHMRYLMIGLVLNLTIFRKISKLKTSPKFPAIYTVRYKHYNAVKQYYYNATSSVLVFLTHSAVEPWIIETWSDFHGC